MDDTSVWAFVHWTIHSPVPIKFLVYGLLT